jgi:large subunit ribosomal protein L15
VKLNELKPAAGSKKARRRVGRGLGSGRGKTAGRGQKGQKSRSGFSAGAGWEGGRSRLIMRLPKRGFNRVKEPFQIVNLSDLNRFAKGDTIDGASLRARGLVKDADGPIKLLGNGALEVQDLKVEVDAASRAAAAAVEAAGGSVAVRRPHDAAEDAAEES